MKYGLLLEYFLIFYNKFRCKKNIFSERISWRNCKKLTKWKINEKKNLLPIGIRWTNEYNIHSTVAILESLRNYLKKIIFFFSFYLHKTFFSYSLFINLNFGVEILEA